MKENIVCFRKNTINKTALIGRKKTYFQDSDFSYTETDNQYYISAYIGNDDKVSILDIKGGLNTIFKKDKFLRATSGASIDTGYIWKSNNVKVEIKFANLTTNSATVFGAEDRVFENTDVSGKYSLIGHTSLYNGLRMAWYIGKVPGLGQSASYPLEGIHKMIIETDNANGKVICNLDGDEQVYENTNATIVNKTVSNSIFSSHFYPNTFTQFAPCDVYYCKMWDNGQLVRDLRPVKSGQTLSGITFTADGFFDRITNLFYGQSTAGGTITYMEE